MLFRSGSVTGRFLEGANVSVSDPDLTAKLDPSKQSTDNRLFFVLTPSKAVQPNAIEFVVTKNKESAKISKQIGIARPIPTLTKVDPESGAQGSDVDVTFTGSNLYDLSPSVKVLRNGSEDQSIPVANVSVTSTTSAKATLSLKNTTPGKVDVWLSIGGIETGTVTFEAKPKQQ